MNAPRPNHADSDRIVRRLDDGRQRGRGDLTARLAPLGDIPGFREGPRRTNVLVVAIDPVVPEGLAHADVLVVAPALNSWLRHWLSDEDPARRRAEERLAAVVGKLQRTVVHIEGRVGDADPLQAIADALPTFPADEIVISARPERSIEHVDDLVVRARERFALPISWAVESRSIAA
jgi:nucleotide-binding universal stress UspA family protein